MSDDKSKGQPNGTEPVENGVVSNGTTEDVEMADDEVTVPSKGKSRKDKEGDDEMTVVVPPSKGSKLTAEGSIDEDGDAVMNGAEETKDGEAEVEKTDPVTKAVSGMLIKLGSVLLVLIVFPFRHQGKLPALGTGGCPIRCSILPSSTTIYIFHAEAIDARGHSPSYH